MIQVKGLNFKNSWNEITLSEYSDIKNILASPNVDEFQKELMVLALLAGSNDFRMFDNWLRSEAHALFQVQEFLYVDPVAELQDYYTIGGIKYKLIKDFDTIESWQFIDLCNILKDDKAQENRLHELCSLFLRKTAPLTVKQAQNNLFIERLSGSEKGRALIEKWGLKYEEPGLEPFSGDLTRETVENLFQNMIFADSFAISVFFCLLSTELSKTALDYLELNQVEKLKSTLKTLDGAFKKNPQLQEIKTSLDALDILKPTVG